MTEASGVAYRVKKLSGLITHGCEAAVYRMDPPLEGNEYVTVSSIIDSSKGMTRKAWDTAIFASTSKGAPTSWDRLPGSSGGVLGHAVALSKAGYRVVEEETK